ncbi:hypothetical protein VTK73DRAFT_5793 [Phialemonium thermophilum]|uniref:Uncharacterized protein n=1 Tax=Phialemonium thermophilum TaxID=223376 RepID=A0ABR3V0G9_9PEZI
MGRVCLETAPLASAVSGSLWVLDPSALQLLKPDSSSGASIGREDEAPASAVDSSPIGWPLHGSCSEGGVYRRRTFGVCYRRGADEQGCQPGPRRLARVALPCVRRRVSLIMMVRQQSAADCGDGRLWVGCSACHRCCGVVQVRHCGLSLYTHSSAHIRQVPTTPPATWSLHAGLISQLAGLRLTLFGPP